MRNLSWQSKIDRWAILQANMGLQQTEGLRIYFKLPNKC